MNFFSLLHSSLDSLTTKMLKFLIRSPHERCSSEYKAVAVVQG